MARDVPIVEPQPSAPDRLQSSDQGRATDLGGHADHGGDDPGDAGRRDLPSGDPGELSSSSGGRHPHLRPVRDQRGPAGAGSEAGELKFLADEDFPGVAVRSLRSLGYDVAWCKEDAEGQLDDEVWARAIREDRVLLTRDQEFGPRSRGGWTPCPPGVVLVRGRFIPQIIAESVLAVILEAALEFRGHLTVIRSPDKVRQSPLGDLEDLEAVVGRIQGAGEGKP